MHGHQAEEIMPEAKPFPEVRRFTVVLNIRFYHRALVLSGGIIAVSSQDNEDLLQEFSTGNPITMRLVHESGRYEHEERISKKSSIKVSLMYWELDDFVKRGLLKEKLAQTK